MMDRHVSNSAQVIRQQWQIIDYNSMYCHSAANYIYARISLKADEYRNINK